MTSADKIQLWLLEMKQMREKYPTPIEENSFEEGYEQAWDEICSKVNQIIMENMV